MTPRRPVRGLFSQARITKGALWLLLIELGFSLVALFASDEGKALIVDYLVATDTNVWKDFKVWTLVTTMFVEPRFIGLLFHGLIMWMFMPALEKWWGTKRFLYFAVGTSATAALIGTLAGSFMAGGGAIAGLDAFIFASIVAYGVVFARTQVYFFAVLPMTGKQLAWGMTAFVTLMVVLQRDWATGAGWASAMLLAFWLTNGLNPRLWWLQWRQRRVRRKLKVIRGGNDKSKWMN